MNDRSPRIWQSNLGSEVVSAPLKAAGSRQVVSGYVRALYDVLHISDSCQEQVREPAAIKIEDAGRRDPAQSRDNAPPPPAGISTSHGTSTTRALARTARTARDGPRQRAQERRSPRPS